MKRYLTAVLLAVLTLFCFLRNAVWLNDGTLWGDTAVKSPRKARGYNELGLYAVGKHKYNEAFGPFLKSLELDPYQPIIYLNLGLAYEGLQQWDMAITMYNKSIFIKNDDPVAYYNMGGIYYDRFNDRVKALELFLKARDLNPLEPDVHYYLSRIYRDMGKHELAHQEFRLYKNLK